MNDGSAQLNDTVPDDVNVSGTVSWLMKPAGAAEAAWLRRLVSLRQAAADYIVAGRRARDLLPANGSAARRVFGPICLASLQAQAWFAADGSSMAVLVASVQQEPAQPELFDMVVPARDVALICGGGGGCQSGVVLERLDGEWATDAAVGDNNDSSNSSNNSSNTVPTTTRGGPPARNVTVLARFGNENDVVYSTNLPPRTLLFYRIRSNDWVLSTQGQRYLFYDAKYWSEVIGALHIWKWGYASALSLNQLLFLSLLFCTNVYVWMWI
jgi:hypothetical protein